MSLGSAQNISFLLSQVRSATTSLVGGKVYFYEAGTSTPQNVWLDTNMTSSAANPYTLDANGTAQIYGYGSYRIVIKDSGGATKYDRDNLNFGNKTVSANATGTGTQVIFPVSFVPSLIYINGVYQNQNTYTLSGGNVTFSEAPPLTSIIEFLI